MTEERVGVGFDYWMRWQAPIYAMIIIAPTVAAVIVIKKTYRIPVRSNVLWRSCWKKIDPRWLLGYRAVVFLLTSLTLFVVAVHDGGFAFYFYTQWTFTLVVNYFAFVFQNYWLVFTLIHVLSAHGCWCHLRKIPNEVEERNRSIKLDSEENRAPASSTENEWASLECQRNQMRNTNEKLVGFWGHIMQITYQTSAGAVMLSDIVFWALIVPFLSDDHFVITLLIGSMHTMNLVFLLLDTALNNMVTLTGTAIVVLISIFFLLQPFPFFRIAYFVLWSCTYVIFQWIVLTFGISWWPYPFLELATPWAPMWYFFVAVGHIPLFGLYYLLVKAKDSFLPILFPDSYLKSY